MAVTGSFDLLSVGLPRLRIGALGPLQPLGLAKAQWPVSEWSSRLTESMSARSSAEAVATGIDLVSVGFMRLPVGALDPDELFV